jgi:hypothetical protein
MVEHTLFDLVSTDIPNKTVPGAVCTQTHIQPDILMNHKLGLLGVDNCQYEYSIDEYNRDNHSSDE